MKKILCIVSVALCIFLTACGDDSSISIIGGADGPTSIIVAEKGEKHYGKYSTNGINIELLNGKLQQALSGVLAAFLFLWVKI